MGILDQHGRLNNLKIRNGLKRTTNKSIDKWKTAVQLRKEMTVAYIAVQEEFDMMYKPRKGTIMEWINNIEALSTVSFKKARDMFDEEGIQVTLVLMIPCSGLQMAA